MLRSMKEITNTYKLLATDGEIGKVRDFFFNDLFWNIKYLVADTGSWLNERLVLISPASLGQPEWPLKKLPVNLTTQKIEDSPNVDRHKPVSKRKEEELIKYYAWPVHFAYGVDTMHYGEAQLMAERMKKAEEERRKSSENKDNDGDSNLRSSEEVFGYHIQATDDSVGHVEDFIFDDETWIIRYIVVDTRNWLPGKKVLISPEWIKNVEWAKSRVSVDLKRETIKAGPEFDPAQPVNRSYEVQLYDYYGRPAYWK